MFEPVEEGSGIVRDLGGESDTLLVAFAGIGRTLDAPAPFEFRLQASSLPVKRIFVRDTQRCWYQRGVAGLGDDIPSTAEALRAEAQAAETPHVVYSGHSAGGYAALLFGHLAGASRVVVFSPRTFLTESLRRRYLDRRFKERLDHVCESAPDATYLDLLTVLGDGNGPVPEVHFPTLNRLDRIHARRLRSVPRVTFRPHLRLRHNFVRTLKESGELGAILKGAIERADPRP